MKGELEMMMMSDNKSSWSLVQRAAIQGNKEFLLKNQYTLFNHDQRDGGSVLTVHQPCDRGKRIKRVNADT
jgi:hypothetical protein